jgi:hypothetical protein
MDRTLQNDELDWLRFVKYRTSFWLLLHLASRLSVFDNVSLELEMSPTGVDFAALQPPPLSIKIVWLWLLINSSLISPSLPADKVQNQ